MRKSRLSRKCEKRNASCIFCNSGDSSVEKTGVFPAARHHPVAAQQRQAKLIVHCIIDDSFRAIG